MEIYFKNLSAEGTSVEKLVEDLVVLAHDVEELVKETGVTLAEHSRHELRTMVQQLRTQCEKLRHQVVVGARATDRRIRSNPYSFLGVAAGIGFVFGLLACTRRR